MSDLLTTLIIKDFDVECRLLDEIAYLGMCNEGVQIENHLFLPITVPFDVERPGKDLVILGFVVIDVVLIPEEPDGLEAFVSVLCELVVRGYQNHAIASEGENTLFFPVCPPAESGRIPTVLVDVTSGSSTSDLISSLNSSVSNALDRSNFDGPSTHLVRVIDADHHVEICNVLNMAIIGSHFEPGARESGIGCHWILYCRYIMMTYMMWFSYDRDFSDTSEVTELPLFRTCRCMAKDIQARLYDRLPPWEEVEAKSGSLALLVCQSVLQTGCSQLYARMKATLCCLPEGIPGALFAVAEHSDE